MRDSMICRRRKCGYVGNVGVTWLASTLLALSFVLLLATSRTSITALPMLLLVRVGLTLLRVSLLL